MVADVRVAALRHAVHLVPRRRGARLERLGIRLGLRLLGLGRRLLLAEHLVEHAHEGVHRDVLVLRHALADHAQDQRLAAPTCAMYSTEVSTAWNRPSKSCVL